MTDEERLKAKELVREGGLDSLRYSYRIETIQCPAFKKRLASYIRAAAALEKFIGLPDEEDDIPW